MSNEIVGQEWSRVKKELLGNLTQLASEDTEMQDVYELMSELLENSKIKPSGGPKSGETKTVP